MAAKVSKDQLELHLNCVFEHNVNFAQRVILLNQDIDEGTFTLVENALTEMESYNGQPITIRVCSEGGDEYAAMAIVGRMKKSKCRIITEGYGQIMSAATLIFAAGNLRRISRFAAFMHHEASYDLNERHENAKAQVAHMEWMENMWAEWMAEFSKKSKKFYLEQAKHTDKYWTPKQLVQYGIADEII